MEKRILTALYDESMESSKWAKEIPYIQFPSDWNVKIIPPYNGAVVRFLITKDKATVSVYLDCYEHLGFFNSMCYWEVYPYEHDVFRCEMNEVGELLKAINQSILEQNQ